MIKRLQQISARINWRFWIVCIPAWCSAAWTIISAIWSRCGKPLQVRKCDTLFNQNKKLEYLCILWWNKICLFLQLWGKHTMSKIEKQFINYIEHHKEMIFLILISIIALLIRYAGRDFISIDMKVSFLKWYDIIKSGGGAYSLKKQVGDYGLLYQTIISSSTSYSQPWLLTSGFTFCTFCAWSMLTAMSFTPVSSCQSA